MYGSVPTIVPWTVSVCLVAAADFEQVAGIGLPQLRQPEVQQLDLRGAEPVRTRLCRA